MAFINQSQPSEPKALRPAKKNGAIKAVAVVLAMAIIAALLYSYRTASIRTYYGEFELLFALKQGRLKGGDWKFKSDGALYIFMFAEDKADIKLGTLYKVEAVPVLEFIANRGGLNPQMVDSFPRASDCLEAVHCAYNGIPLSRSRELADIVHGYLDRNREKILRDLVDKKSNKVLQWDHVDQILLIRDAKILSSK